jgi:PAS domain S-box-containing protein
MAELDHLLTVAEELAQLGSWQLDFATGGTTWSPGLYRLLGLAPDAVERDEEAILAVVHPEDRERIAAMLRAVAESEAGVERELELRIIRADGAVRDVRARGRVEGDETGRPVRWVGVLQDVTDDRRRQGELQAHYAVSQALREWETFEEGAVDLLRRIGTALEYPMGSLWLWDDDQGALVCRAFWSAPDVDPGGFEAAKRSLTFKPGQGKPGRAWQEQHPVVTADVAADETFMPRAAALESGVRSALAFPAIGPDGPVAVLSFYGLESRAPSASLVRTVTAIGSDLGRFLHRRRADLGPRPLSARELEVLRLAVGGQSGPEIAEALYISPTTVKTHFEHIYEKLGVSDRLAAVALALRTGLLR